MTSYDGEENIRQARKFFEAVKLNPAFDIVWDVTRQSMFVHFVAHRA
jgi:hypothetical protein